jgi:hypothetical protein
MRERGKEPKEEWSWRSRRRKVESPALYHQGVIEDIAVTDS